MVPEYYAFIFLRTLAVVRAQFQWQSSEFELSPCLSRRYIKTLWHNILLLIHTHKHIHTYTHTHTHMHTQIEREGEKRDRSREIQREWEGKSLYYLKQEVHADFLFYRIKDTNGSLYIKKNWRDLVVGLMSWLSAQEPRRSLSTAPLSRVNWPSAPRSTRLNDLCW